MSLPNGPLIVAVSRIKQMLLDCAHFTGTAHIDALPAPASGMVYTADELTALRPFALIWQSQGDGWSARVKSIGGDCINPSGHARIQIELPVPEDMTSDDALGTHVLTAIGRIIQTNDANSPGLLDLSGLPGRPFIRRINVGDYGRVPSELILDLGDFVMCEIDVWWGNDG